MKALRRKDILDMLSEELGYDKKIIEDAVDCYWEQVISSIRNLEHLNIFIQELGELRIAKSRIERFQDGLRRAATKYKPESYMFQSLIKKIEDLDRLIEMREKEYEKRNITRERRKDYEKTKKDMEK